MTIKKSTGKVRASELQPVEGAVSFTSAMRAVTDLLEIVLNSRALIALVVGYSCPGLMSVVGSLWLRP
jgi:hypothetical protein